MPQYGPAARAHGDRRLELRAARCALHGALPEVLGETRVHAHGLRARVDADGARRRLRARSRQLRGSRGRSAAPGPTRFLADARIDYGIVRPQAPTARPR